MMPERAQEAESTAPTVVPTFRSCRHCQAPVQQPTRRGQIKDFCNDRHRAAFRDNLVQGAIQEAKTVLAEASAELAQWSARMDGAMALLDRYARHGAKRKKVVDASS